MALTTFDYDMSIIQKLDDEPNDVGGLSAAQLKAKFDEGGEQIKDYLNNTLLPETEKIFATKQELDDLQAGISPDLTATEEVLAAM